MANSIKLDWTEKEILYEVATDVIFVTDDKTEKVKLTDEQLEDLFDQYRESIGEKTVSELEERILELEIALENAHEIIEAKEQQEDLMREKFFDCTY